MLLNCNNIVYLINSLSRGKSCTRKFDGFIHWPTGKQVIRVQCYLVNYVATALESPPQITSIRVPNSDDPIIWLTYYKRRMPLNWQKNYDQRPINLFYFLNSLLKMLSKDLSFIFKIKICLACICSDGIVNVHYL